MADTTKFYVSQMVAHRDNEHVYKFWRTLYLSTKESAAVNALKRALFFKDLAAQFESKGREKPLALFID